MLMHLFFIHAFAGQKFCPPLINSSSLRVPSRNIRNFTPSSLSRKYCPSDRCATAAHLVRNDIDIFSKQIKTLNQILRL
jgi:hypothetical protein